MDLKHSNSYSSPPPIDLISAQDPNPKNILVLQTLIKITQKQFELRTIPENIYLYNSLKNLKHVQRLLQHTDKDTIKSLLKLSTLSHLTTNDILFSSSHKSQYYYVLIKGRIQITSSEQKSLDDHLVGGLLFDMIFQFAEIKSKHSNDAIRNKLEEKQYFTRIIEEQQPFGDDLYQMHKVKSYQAKAVDECYVLKIPLSNYMNVYKIFNERRIQWMKVLFRKFRSFDILEDKCLLNLIKECQQVTKLKKDIVYEEGDKLTHIYILKKGQIEITKKGIEEDKKSKQVENSLYSSPEKKQEAVVISILSNQNMFGEQDIRLGECTTTAKVISSEATYYSLSIQKLQQILKRQNYTLADFNSYLELKSSRKRNYRQTRFSEVMNIRKRVNSVIDKSPQKHSASKLQLSQNSMMLSRLLHQNKMKTSRIEIIQKRQTDLDLSVLLTKSKIEVYQELNLPSTSRKRKLKSASPFRPSNNLSQDKSQTHRGLFLNNKILDNPLFQLNYFRDFEKERRRRIRDSHQRMETTLNRTRTLSRKTKIII